MRHEHNDSHALAELAALAAVSAALWHPFGRKVLATMAAIVVVGFALFYGAGWILLKQSEARDQQWQQYAPPQAQQLPPNGQTLEIRPVDPPTSSAPNRH